MQILGSELILNVLSLNSLILQVCLLSWHQLRNWLYATSNLVPMLLPGQTCNSPARRISALPTNSFPTPIAQIWARSQRMRKGSSPPGILRRREGLAGFFFHGADCGRPASPQAATEPLRPRCHQAWVHGQSTHITQAHGKIGISQVILIYKLPKMTNFETMSQVCCSSDISLCWLAQ